MADIQNVLHFYYSILLYYASEKENNVNSLKRNLNLALAYINFVHPIL